MGRGKKYGEKIWGGIFGKSRVEGGMVITTAKKGAAEAKNVKIGQKLLRSDEHATHREKKVE